MKKLSIEEKARAYDEAIRKAKIILGCCNSASIITKHTIYDIFPELAESEDEQIRGAIIDHLKDYNLTEWAAWLEKQEGCEHIKKDWLEHIKQSWYREGFIDGKYSDVKGCTINDDVILKELIDFLENRTAKLQHDLTRYANWLKIKFTPKKHLE